MGSLNLSALPKGSRLALDTATIVYFLEKHPTYYPQARQIFQSIEQGRFTGIMSSLVFAELLVPAYRAGRPQEAEKVLQILNSFPNLEIAALTPAIASEAAILRAQFGVRTPDAIHLATAISHKADGFITNDKGFQRMGNKLAIWMMDGD